MKNKDIKNKIKNQAIAEMPDVLNRINLEEINIEENVNSANRSNWKSFINLRLVFTTLILIISGVVVFNIFNSQSNTGVPLEADYEVLAFETISSATLLEYSETEVLDTSSDRQIIELSDNSASDIDIYLKDIRPLIELSEIFINSEEKITYEKLDSDLAEYQYLVNFRAEDLTETIIQYKLYYNQNNDNIEGVIALGDVNYSFTKDNSSFKTYKNESDYIEVSINTKDDKQTFSYQMYKNNQLQFFTNMELTKVNNQYMAKYNYNNNQGLQIGLEMQRNNQNQFDVDFDITDQSQNMRGRFNVNVEQENGESSYRFSFPDNSESCETRGKGNNPHCE